MEFGAVNFSPGLFYAALFAFLTAVSLMIWQRASGTKGEKQLLSERLDKAVHYFWQDKRRKKITNDMYQKLTGVSDATATRDLQKLEELGLLVQKGRTRDVYYLFTLKAKRHLRRHKIGS